LKVGSGGGPAGELCINARAAVSRRKAQDKRMMASVLLIIDERKL